MTTPSTLVSIEDSYPPQLSLTQRLSLFPLIFTLPIPVVFNVFRHNTGRSWKRSLGIALYRALFSRGYSMDVLVRAVAQPTGRVYATFARDNRLELVTEDVGEGARLHWIGPKKTERVFLYFHGGGYSVPSGPQYFDFVHSLKKDVTAALGPDVGFAFLEYSLTPRAPFPTQLRQATAALAHLLQSGIPPSGIIISGDSAGGNLCLQVTSHLLHPLAGVPAPPKLSEPLGGAALISPWVAFHEKGAASYKRNDARDWIPRKFYDEFAAQVRPGVTPALRAHVEPLEAPKGWWTGAERVVKRFVVFGGENEGIFDQILEMAEVLKAETKDVTMVAEPGAVHEDMINRFSSGEGGQDGGYKDLLSWLLDTFGRA
ncbi:Alpha/Beta hydrolase protein [Gloeopeniophorella convolvens]|nr:Alpha/Beta hydrolase protein [Gloeopeniophorella convolvens]